MNKKHFGEIQNGKFKPFDKLSFVKEFAKREGKVVFVTVEERKKNRSLDQNSYYWGVVIELISEETGMTPEEVHEAMKWKFLKKSVNDIETVESTTKLTTAEMGKFIDNIILWAGEFLGVYVPPADSIKL